MKDVNKLAAVSLSLSPGTAVWSLPACSRRVPPSLGGPGGHLRCTPTEHVTCTGDQLLAEANRTDQTPPPHPCPGSRNGPPGQSLHTPHQSSCGEHPSTPPSSQSSQCYAHLCWGRTWRPCLRAPRSCLWLVDAASPHSQARLCSASLAVLKPCVDFQDLKC